MRLPCDVILDDWMMYENSSQSQKQNLIEGAANRLRKFLRNDIIRSIIGQKEKTLNCQDIMEKNKILLINLNGADKITNDNTKLLGIMIVNEFFRVAKLRDPRDPDLNPFYFYIDEFANFITKDIARSLEETRKFKMFMILAHQHLAQLKDEDEYLYASVMTNCKNKMIFGGLSIEDSKIMTEEAQTGFLDLKKIKHKMYRTRVTHHEETRTVHTKNNSKSASESRTASESKMKGTTTATGESDSISEGTMQGTTEGDTFSTTQGKSHADSKSQSNSTSQGTAETSTSAKTKGYSDSVSHNESHGDSSAESFGYNQNKTALNGRSTAESKTSSNSEGTSTTEGKSDSKTEAQGYSNSESKGNSLGESDSQGNTANHSYGDSRGESRQWDEHQQAYVSRNTSHSRNNSHGNGRSESHAKSYNENSSNTASVSNTQAQTQANSTTEGRNNSHSSAESSTVGQNESEGTSYGHSGSNTHGLTDSTTEGTSHSDSVSENTGFSTGSNDSKGRTDSIGVSDAKSSSESNASSKSKNDSKSNSATHTDNHSISDNKSTTTNDGIGHSSSNSEGFSVSEVPFLRPEEVDELVSVNFWSKDELMYMATGELKNQEVAHAFIKIDSQKPVQCKIDYVKPVVYNQRFSPQKIEDFRQKVIENHPHYYLSREDAKSSYQKRQQALFGEPLRFDEATIVDKDKDDKPTYSKEDNPIG